MSNRAHFTRTKFSDVDGGNVTFGYRAADDFVMYYDDTWATPGPESDLEFLAHIIETGSESVQDLISWIAAEEKGCYINGDWHTYEEIRDVVTNFEVTDASEEE